MSITVEAIYENGALKLSEPLPFNEHEKVQVTVQVRPSIQAALAAVERSYGSLPWTGNHETLRRIAEDDEFGLLESP